MSLSPEIQTYKATTQYRSDKFEKKLLEEVFKYVDLSVDAKQLKINQITGENIEADKTRALNTYLKDLDNMTFETAGKIYAFIHKTTNPEIDSLMKNLTAMGTSGLNAQYYDEAARALTWLSYPIKLSQEEYDQRLTKVALSVLTTNFIKDKVNITLYNELKKDFVTKLNNTLKKSFQEVFKKDLNYQNVLNDEYIKANLNLDITEFERTVTDLKIDLDKLRLGAKDILINGTKYNFRFKEDAFKTFDALLGKSSDFIDNFKKQQFINSFNSHVEEALKDLNHLLKEFKVENINYFINLKTKVSATVYWKHISGYLQKDIKIDITAFREKLVDLYLNHLEVKEKGVTRTDLEIYQIKLSPEEIQRQEQIINFLTELAIHLRDEKLLENYTQIENTKNPHLLKHLTEYRTKNCSIIAIQEVINELEKDKTYLKKLDIINAYTALIDHVSNQENFDTEHAAEKKYAELVNLAILDDENPQKIVYLSADLKLIITEEHAKIKHKTLTDYNAIINHLKGELKNHYKNQKAELEKEIEPHQKTIQNHENQIKLLENKKAELKRILGPLVI
jgi:hypothetical protein